MNEESNLKSKMYKEVPEKNSHEPVEKKLTIEDIISMLEIAVNDANFSASIIELSLTGDGRAGVVNEDVKKMCIFERLNNLRNDLNSLNESLYTTKNILGE